MDRDEHGGDVGAWRRLGGGVLLARDTVPGGLWKRQFNATQWSHEERSNDAKLLGHEPSGANVRAVWQTGAGLAWSSWLSLLLGVGLMLILGAVDNVVPGEPVGEQVPVCPACRSSTRSAGRTARIARAGGRLLDDLWMDGRAAGVARIPIERAMQIIAAEGTARNAAATGYQSAHSGWERPTMNAESQVAGVCSLMARSSRGRIGSAHRDKRPLQSERAACRSSRHLAQAGRTSAAGPEVCRCGRARRALGDCFGERPVILHLVYYECPMLCKLSSDGLLRALDTLSLKPGQDFSIVTLSFDPREGPELSAARAAGGDRAMRPRGGRKRLAILSPATKPAIAKLCDAVGFRYVYDDKTRQYAHATGVFVLDAGRHALAVPERRRVFAARLAAVARRSVGRQGRHGDRSGAADVLHVRSRRRANMAWRS